MTQLEIDEAIWLQLDAAYTYALAQMWRDDPAPGFSYAAVRVQEAAAHSAAMARDLLGVVEG